VRLHRRRPCGCVETILRDQNGNERVVSTALCPVDHKAEDERLARSAQEAQERSERIPAVDRRVVVATSLAVMRAVLGSPAEPAREE
jgi:hypothetical protein